MKAGRELDALIAEKVMGWKKLYRKDYTNVGDWHGLDWMYENKQSAIYYDAQTCPSYSVDIAAAWEVVEKLSANRPLSTTLHVLASPGGNYCVNIFQNFMDSYGQWRQKDLGYVVEDTVPHAICLAALKLIDLQT